MILKSILELSAKETLSDYITAIAWSPMGNTVAAASGSGEVRLLSRRLRRRQPFSTMQRTTSKTPK